MAIMVTFSPASMTPAQYDEIIRRLNDAGVSSPPGRLHHVAVKASGTLRVVDVYDSPASFQAFGQVLVPILQEVGVVLPPPQIEEVYQATT